MRLKWLWFCDLDSGGSSCDRIRHERCSVSCLFRVVTLGTVMSSCCVIGCSPSSSVSNGDAEQVVADSPAGEGASESSVSLDATDLLAAFRKIQLDYQSTSRKHRSKLRQAKSAEDKAKLANEAPDSAAAVKSAIDLYEDHEADPSYLDMAGWVVRTSEDAEPVRTVLEVVKQHHTSHSEFDRFLNRPYRLGVPVVAEFVNELAAKGDSPASMVARFLITTNLDAEADQERIIQLMQSIVDFAGEVKYGANDYKLLADGRLFSIRRLQVGSEIPDIEGPDVDGEVFRLADYRGKVIMLDFWGDW